MPRSRSLRRRRRALRSSSARGSGRRGGGAGGPKQDVNDDLRCLRARSRSRSEDTDDLFAVELLPGRHQEAFPAFDLPVEDRVDGEEGKEALVPHVCARVGEGYVIRVTNDSSHHVACALTVDGENALLRDGSLIVAPGDRRELPGFLVSKNFIGKEYVKEYRDFRFGKPKVIESNTSGDSLAEDMPYKTYGRVVCDIFEAILDEEVDSDQELRGQTTHFRGAGLHGSFDERKVPEGKKKHFIYSAVTIQGPRSSMANSTRGRWWIRGPRKLRTLEVRYREAHSLMLLGVDAKALGLMCRQYEDGNSRVKKEGDDDVAKKEEDDEKDDKEKLAVGGGAGGLIEICDLTGDDQAEAALWSVGTDLARSTYPVEVDAAPGSSWEVA